MVPLPRLLSLTIAALLVWAGAARAECPPEPGRPDFGAGLVEAIPDCAELDRFTLPTPIPREAVVYGPRGAPAGALASLRQGLEDAARTLGDLGLPEAGDVRVYIVAEGGIDYGFDAMMVADAGMVDDPDATGGALCIIRSSGLPDAGEIRWTAAHEYFHCAQNRHFDAQMRSGGSAWWVEGTADWFASLANPGHDVTFLSVGEFDAESPTTPLTGFTYQSAVFFFWLHQRRGPEAVIDLIRAMPADGGSQEDALAAIIDDEAFLDFAKAYLDTDIPLPDGRMPGLAPRTGDTWQWESRTAIDDLEALRFVVFRGELLLACGFWSLTEYEPVEGLLKARRLDAPGDWADIPARVEGGDENYIRFRLAGGGTGEEGFRTTLEGIRDLCRPCEAPPPDEQTACLIGDWRLVEGGVGAAIRERVDGLAGIDMPSYPDIDGRLSLNADGTFVAGTSDDGFTAIDTEDGPATFDYSLSFERRGSWSVVDGKLEFCEDPATDFRLDGLMDMPNFDAEDIDLREAETFQQPAIVTREFTCTPGRLEILDRGGFFAPDVLSVYTR